MGDLFVELSAGLADGDDIEALLQRFLVPVLRLSGRQGRRGAGPERGRQATCAWSAASGCRRRCCRPSVRSTGIAASAARRHTSGVLVWAGDLQALHAAQPWRHSLASQCKRLLAVPLRHRDQVLGIYNLFFDDEGAPGPDITAVLRSVGELLGLALHNARLEREHLRAAVLHERQMLANEVHDAVAQTLYFMNMRLPLLHDALLQHDEPRALRYHADLRQAVSDAHASLREILTHYRTRMDPKGLLHALQALQAGYRERTGIELVLDHRAADLNLSVDQELQVFHIVQEALANVVKHSHARNGAGAASKPAQQQLEIVIEDDGEGLLPMRRRSPARRTSAWRSCTSGRSGWAASLSIQPREGGGTRVQLVHSRGSAPSAAGTS